MEHHHEPGRKKHLLTFTGHLHLWHSKLQQMTGGRLSFTTGEPPTSRWISIHLVRCITVNTFSDYIKNPMWIPWHSYQTSKTDSHYLQFQLQAKYNHIVSYSSILEVFWKYPNLWGVPGTAPGQRKPRTAIRQVGEPPDNWALRGQNVNSSALGRWALLALYPNAAKNG